MQNENFLFSFFCFQFNSLNAKKFIFFRKLLIQLSNQKLFYIINN